MVLRIQYWPTVTLTEDLWLFVLQLSMDTEYLKKHLGKCLVDCLVEVSEKRPLDPIEYIAQWLHTYIENVKHAEQVSR